MRFHCTGRATVAWASLCVIPFYANPLTAQEENGDFLGTIVLGESKREVQTDTAVPVTVVDETEIEDRQAGTVAELIDSVPGVNLVNGATAQGSGINIRGYGANGTFGTDQKVLIQIDGATRGSEELYRIGNQLFTDPFLYKELEVRRGTIGSFEFGSGVVGGVVRLETKDASDITGGEIGFALRQTFEFQSNGDGIASSTILAWQPTANLEFLAQYARRNLGVQTDGDGNDINPEGGEIDDPSWLIKGRYTFGQNNDQSITFSYQETESDQRDVPYDTFGLADFGNVDRFTRNNTASLRYNYNPQDNDLLDLTVALTYAEEEINNTPVTPGSPLLDADHLYETTTFSIKNTSLFETGIVSHDLRTGIEFIRRERLDAFAAPGGTDNRIAAFAVSDMRIGERLTISPAVRYETSEIEGSTAPNSGTFDNSALMGGLAVRYEWPSGFAVFASAAYTENLPIIDDLGNANFMTQPEKARTYEIGASFDSSDVFATGDALALKANLYSTDLWDITSYTIPGSMTDNPEEVTTEGLELELSYAMQSGFYIDLNANIARGEAFDTGLGFYPWGNTPADTARLTVGRKFGEELDLSWEMVAAARFDDVLSTEDPSPGFGVHNLRATYVPQTGVLQGTEIRLGIENVFDKTYTPRLSTRPSAGRNIKLTLARTF
ncbi:TonB-dependent receptor domain-containing protein [Thalassococcus sp. S3]|uniref:TonB-dependent receptor domain-containing protein n=1 Tax=Thalassococcus sp. S3 TaxID=2017482 RepID=UPI0010240A05|nr:TonB-dependent receptor [Thalassococcus sp. S3]QBF30456.1 ligand-gated channel [Thalassococcus sp. S3]